MLERINHYICELKKYREFGLVTSFRLVICSSRMKYEKRNQFEKGVKRDYINNMIKSIPISEYAMPDEKNSGPVWFCWWQGKGAMPAIVKVCWRRLNECVRDREIIFIDKDNYSEYVDIDACLLSKFAQNKISITHFSDILRFYLLYYNGGVWVDSTIFINKCAAKYLWRPFFTLSVEDKGTYISKGKWGGFLFGSNKGNPLFRFLIDCYILWWNKHDKLIDYFSMDYFIAYAYENNPTLKDMIDKYAFFCKDLYYLQRNLLEPLCEEHMEAAREIPFNKLTWKYIQPVPGGTVCAYIENIY